MTIDMKRASYLRPGDLPDPGHRWAYARHFSLLVQARGFDTFRKLAEAAGVPQPSISYIMLGRVPRDATVEKLLSAMGATWDDLRAEPRRAKRRVGPAKVPPALNPRKI